jgi:hypothetical protein
MKLSEVPKFTRNAAYHVNSDLWYFPETIQRYQEEYNLDIDPDFQRAHVWTPDKQIAFMEYLFKGGQLSNRFLFNYPNWMGNMHSTTEIMVLVDGKQRLEAITQFLDNNLPVFGRVKEEWEDVKIACRRVQLDIYINDLTTRKEVLQWYIDLNAGGVVHTDEEIAKVKDLLKECD